MKSFAEALGMFAISLFKPFISWYHIYVAASKFSDVEKLEAFVKVNGPTTIIFDEANYFNVNVATSRSVFDCLIRLSKEQNVISVILACSEFNIP